MGRQIEAELMPKRRDVFRRRRLAEHLLSDVAGQKLDRQEDDERDDEEREKPER